MARDGIIVKINLIYRILRIFLFYECLLAKRKKIELIHSVFLNILPFLLFFNNTIMFSAYNLNLCFIDRKIIVKLCYGLDKMPRFPVG